jgi:uncharacterized protein YprB with RNaseH-like and TPR domain
MISEELRRRISLLNRSAVRSPVRSPQGEVRNLPFDKPVSVSSVIDTPAARTLEEVVPGQVFELPPSRFYLIGRRLSEMHHSATLFIDRFHSCFAEGRWPAILDETRAALAQYHPRKWLFLDIETCGLSNSPIFLVGLMTYAGSDFELLQLLARDYSEEASVLSYLAGRLPDFDTLLTFNGKTFDWPFLQDRSSVHRVTLPEPVFHFDVLHASRKQWGRAMPNCKLQTLERYICRRIRRGDIPGEQIPDAYHEFVKTGRPERMVDILHHNALDLITMSELTLNLFSEDDTAYL